jgi:hypothetical protein
MEKTADMINMVAYPKPTIYNAYYPGTGPEVRIETGLLGPIQKNFFKALFRAWIQTCRAAGVRARLNANAAFFPKRTIPTAHTATAYTKNFGNFDRWMTGFKKLNGLLAPLFKNNGVSGWSHSVPPPRNIGP